MCNSQLSSDAGYVARGRFSASSSPLPRIRELPLDAAAWEPFSLCPAPPCRSRGLQGRVLSPPANIRHLSGKWLSPALGWKMPAPFHLAACRQFAARAAPCFFPGGYGRDVYHLRLACVEDAIRNTTFFILFKQNIEDYIFQLVFSLFEEERSVTELLASSAWQQKEALSVQLL